MIANYYVSRKGNLMKTFDHEMSLVKPILMERYDVEFSNTIAQEARQEFESLIPQIPFIGGSKNSMTSDLMESVHLLALYRVMKAHGRTAQETSEIVYLGMKKKLAQYPRLLLRLMGRLEFTEVFVRRLQRLAAESQKRTYPDNFVFDVVIGDDDDFDWGLDFTECAIHKFYLAQNASEFLLYVCPMDYLTSEAFGLGMVRTQTLVEGAEKCDPRLKRGRQTERLVKRYF